MVNMRAITSVEAAYPLGSPLSSRVVAASTPVLCSKMARARFRMARSGGNHTALFAADPVEELPFGTRAEHRQQEAQRLRTTPPRSARRRAPIFSVPSLSSATIKAQSGEQGG